MTILTRLLRGIPLAGSKPARALPAASSIAIGLTLVCVSSVSAVTTLFEDPFDSFELGTTWQPHGAGVPQLALGTDGDALQMQSDNSATEFRGIESIDPISLDGLTNVTVNARLRPVNQGVEGSRSAAEVAVFGSTGEFLRAFAANNAGPDPESVNDWADLYADSKDNEASSGPWSHCDSPACDAIRNLVLTVDATGTTFQSFDDDDNATATYETHFDNFTFADLGSELTIALRQEAVQGGDPVMGFFDSITVTTEGSEVVDGLGDVNLDGDVNGLDVDPFVEVLLSGPYQPEADMNEDQVVNGLDVDPFVTAVVGGAQSIPEPSTLLLALVALGVVGGWRKWKRAA
jgi:hypothetical protein